MELRQANKEGTGIKKHGRGGSMARPVLFRRYLILLKSPGRVWEAHIDCLRQISAEIAKPLRFENVLDYLPTQYICDFIRSNGFDGVRYKSVMREGVGNNLAVFDEMNLQCVNVEVHDVGDISYSYNKCK